MSEILVAFVDRDDELVELVLRLVSADDEHALGDASNWHRTETVAVAAMDGRLAGMATLWVPTTMHARAPAILGLWVLPGVRRRGVATALLAALAHYSLRHFEIAPRIGIWGSTAEALIDAVRRGGVPLQSHVTDRPVATRRPLLRVVPGARRWRCEACDRTGSGVPTPRCKRGRTTHRLRGLTEKELVELVVKGAEVRPD